VVAALGGGFGDAAAQEAGSEKCDLCHPGKIEAEGTTTASG
jgi:hypothetical protein